MLYCTLAEMRIEEGTAMLAETAQNIAERIEDLDSCWSQARAVIYDRSSLQTSNKKLLSYRERSVRGCIRSLDGVGQALVSQENAGVSTRYMSVRLSRGIESLTASLDRLRTFLAEESSIQTESAMRIQNLMGEMSSCISEIIAEAENLSDEIEGHYFNRLRQDPFGYELADESDDYNY